MIAAPISMRRFKTKTGRWWLPAHLDSAYTRVIRRGGIGGEAVVRRILTLIRPGMDVIDIGSGFGQDTVLYAKHLKRISERGSTARVYAFDAEPRIFGVLCKNVAEHRCDNVVLCNKAVWHTGGQSLFLANPEKPFGYGNAWVISPAGPWLDWTGAACKPPEQAVESVAIDDLGLDNIGVLKVDAEGADLWALQGSVETIQRCQMPIVFEYNGQVAAVYGTDWPAWQDFFTGIGYEISEKLDKANFLAEPLGAAEQRRAAERKRAEPPKGLAKPKRVAAQSKTAKRGEKVRRERRKRIRLLKQKRRRRRAAKLK